MREGVPHGAHSQEGQLPGRYPREEGCEDLLREDEPHDGHEAACDAPIQHLAPGVVEQVDPGGHRALLSSGEPTEAGPIRAVRAHAEATPGPDPQAAGGGGTAPQQRHPRPLLWLNWDPPSFRPDLELEGYRGSPVPSSELLSGTGEQVLILRFPSFAPGARGEGF